MTIRQAGIDDLPELMRIGQCFLRETTDLFHFGRPKPTALANALIAMLEAENAAIFIAEKEGKVVGTLGGWILPVWFDPSILYVRDQFWYVQPDYRKERVGLDLLIALEKWGESLGINRIAMGTMDRLRGETIGRLLRRRGYVGVEHFWAREK